MIISKNIAWIQEYIDVLDDLKFNFSKLDKITGINSIPLSRIQSYEAITYEENHRYEIRLVLTYQGKYKPFKTESGDHACLLRRMPFSKMDTLVALSHELAHVFTEHFHHTPRHKNIECLVMTQFTEKLKENGYISEEKELG